MKINVPVKTLSINKCIIHARMSSKLNDFRLTGRHYRNDE